MERRQAMSGVRRLLPMAVIGCVGLAGCASSARVGCYQAPCDNCTPSGRVVPVPTRPDVLPDGNFIQPQRNTFDPSNPPGQPSQPNPMFQAVPPGTNQQSTLRPPPGDPGVRLTPPENGSTQPDVKLKGPEAPAEPPRAVDPTPGQEPMPVMPPATDADDKLPITDIPGVVLVRPRLLTGQQPFPDGIRWLSQHGYRTVLHLRSPEETDTAAQRVFEKQNLRYVELRVSAQTVTPEAVAAFNRQIADANALPLFVYERGDGVLTGMMWYLHYRTEQMTEERALAETARLGFRPEADATHRAALDAANSYLRDHSAQPRSIR
jgi:protein tyrosine phosphatase (PTP) superfamily phosphohydrolase (DUF442 family)